MDSTIYLVECITPDRLREDRVIQSTAWLRQMVGAFPTFEAAHTWMMQVGSKRYDTLIIHPLKPPEKLDEALSS
jgi:hypothetical protein